MSQKKTYVLDTNVLLSDPNSINAFEENDVIIPMAVLEELDRHKSRPDEVGRNGRQVSRTLDDMREKGGSLVQGIQLASGGLLKIVAINADILKDMPQELRDPKVDNLIIGLMKKLTLETASVPGMSFPILVSKDINVRIKCDSLGIKCEDYRKMRVAENTQKFYRGVEVVEMPEEMVDYFYRHGKLDLPDHIRSQHPPLYPNQVVVIKNTKGGQTTKSALAKCIDPSKPLVPVAKIENAFGLTPRNKEQSFSLDLLFDEEIKLLTLVGPSGTGKTLLALAAGLEQLRGLGSPTTARYDKLIVTRPVQPVGKDIGFLPGSLEEKMEPWIAPIRDNLNFLMDSKRNRPKRKTRGEHRDQNDDSMYLKLMQERGLIEIEAITFIRGRSIPNAFIVIDEAQNLSMHELKTIITRVGDGTKIILTGDIEQIDNVHVDVFTNGLTYAVERFKEHPIAGHVTLIKGERSKLATLASKIL
jgi:PhoH-like ATPase